MRRALCFLIFISSLFLVVFCTKQTPTVLVLYDRPPRTLDPHMRNEVVTISLLSNIYEGLIDYTPDLRITPCLARAYYRTDSLNWIFDLRQDVYFHNDRKMKAEDVVYSLYRPIRTKGTENAGLVRVIDTIYAINSYRVAIKTKFPYYSLLNELDRLYIIPAGYNEFSRPAGTGPCKATFVSEDSIVCEVFNNYWRKKPEVSKAIFKFIPKLEERMEIFKACESCIIYGIPIDLYYQLQDSLKMVVLSGVAARYIQLNLKIPPFNNKDFRRALSFSINRQEIDDDLYYGLAEPANQFIPKGFIGYCSDLPPLDYHPDSAQRLIKGFRGIKINFYYGKTVQEIGSKVAYYLRSAGIDVVEHAVETDEFWEGVEKRKFDFFLISSVGTTLDGLTGVLESFFYTYSPEKGTGLMNRSNFSNTKVDSLIDYAGKIEDPDERLNVTKKMQMILLNEMPIIPLLWEPRIYAISEKIEFSPRIDQAIRLAEIKFKK